MIFNSLVSLFKKNKSKSLGLPESVLLKKLKKLAHSHQFLIFENITIYHHSKNFFIPLLMVDKKKGIFLFEYKGWTYDELKNAKAEKATQQTSSENTLAFEKAHEFMRRKFKELLHQDEIPITNYLLMENLNVDQYKHLDESFHQLLPEEKILFHDSSDDQILSKLSSIEQNVPSEYEISTIISSLLIQYAIIDNKQKIHLASDEQMHFINSQLVSFEILRGPTGSGKTSAILLKAILEKLKNPNLKIVIIKSTNLACDILKKKLLDIVEHAIIEVDLTSIEIVTPLYYTNRSVRYDLTICDDAWSLELDFLEKLKKVQNNNHIIMVENSNKRSEKLTFTKNFKNQYKDTFFYEANPYAKTLQIISSLLLTSNSGSIMVIGSEVDQLKLHDDLEYFIKDTITVLDAKKSLVEQDLDKLVLASYNDICAIDKDYVIMINIAEANIKKLEYAFNLCSKSVYVVYDKSSENLNLIRNKFENKKD